MITHIRMKNFKSWEDSGEVILAPLTSFFGTNSSGKSSLLQMLLLLKQTIKKEEVIFFGDENSLVNLGNFREVIHGHKEEEFLELEYGCKVDTPFSIEFSSVNNNGVIHTTSLTIDSFTFGINISCKNGSPVVEEGSYRVKSENEERVVKGYFSKKICGEPYPSQWLNDPIVPISSKFKELFHSTYYLGPTRVHPKRLYRWEKTHPKEIDLWGNEAVDALLSARVRQLTTAHNGESVSIEKRISKWLQKLDLADSFWLGPIGNLSDNNYEVRIQKSPNSAKVTLADMGHGVADLFPLLVHCCYVPEGSTLILEQPGVHLHPKAQADLADLFLEVIKERNLQILVESHSEHLLTRLQRRVAEKQIGQDDVALHFCRNADGVSTIERLEVGEFGEIKNWPDNFFGDVMGDMFAMTDKQVKQINEQDPEG